jgi:hypothetical protein
MGTLIAAGVQSLPGPRAATGSALVNSARQISASIGVALLVTIVGGNVGVSSRDDFRWVWSVAAALTLATAAVGLLLSRTPRATPVPEPALT